jgi:signal transduction histidine kinase
VFKSLQARLILSYVVIIVVCLALVGLAALLMLRGYQQNLIFARLEDRVVLAAASVSQQLRRGASPQEAVDRLAEQMNRGDGPPTSVYLLDAAGGAVASRGEELDGLEVGQLTARARPLLDPPVHGDQRLEDGRRLLYVAEVVRVPDERQQAAPHILVLAQPYRPMRSAVGSLFPRMMWAGAVALALSIVLAALMAYSIARPLERIARAAEEVSAGNYDQQLEISTPTEVARLATSFNSMALRVQASLQTQQDLVANVSHELKTPLTSIQGFSQALLDGTADDPGARKRAAAVIHEEAGRMRRLVDELLDLARLEGGQVSLACEPVDVANLMRTCADRFTPEARRLGCTLLVEVPSSLPPVLGDTERLEQVFGNLVDNALKQMCTVTDEGRVILRAEAQDQQVLCSVTDNGPGIAADDLQRVFERFYQVDKSRVRRGSGAGLGLAIAQEIIEAHGGRIHAESVQGLGTRLTVELPARPE